ncbi:MAG: metallophosphoesterase [Candidatus Woesearchaeota archaeon]
MDIYAFVDLHGIKKAFATIMKRAKDADIIVCAGDISDWGQGYEPFIRQLSLLNIPVLMIHGNHEGEDELRHVCSKYPNMMFIHKACYQLGKHLFFGYGGGGFAAENEEFAKIAQRFSKDIQKDSTVIMVTHGPPYGTKIDNIPNLGHRGCKSMRQFIEDKKPVLWVCGHLHETSGMMDVVGKTVVVNPGPEGKMIKI